jgi:hypothetical protein
MKVVYIFNIMLSCFWLSLKTKLQTLDRRCMHVMRELAREGQNRQDLFIKTTKEKHDNFLDHFCSSYV